MTQPSTRNTANVNAIRAALADYVDEIGTIDAAYREEPDLLELAEWLASRGVLVPSALTDFQAEIVHSSTVNGRFEPDTLRHNLEGFARGDVAGA